MTEGIAQRRTVYPNDGRRSPTTNGRAQRPPNPDVSDDTRENRGPTADVEGYDDRWVLEQSRLALHWVFYYYVNCSMYLQIQGGSPSLGTNIFGGTTLLGNNL